MTPTLLDHLHASARDYEDKYPGVKIWLEGISQKNSFGQRELKDPNSHADKSEMRAFRLLVLRDERF